MPRNPIMKELAALAAEVGVTVTAVGRSKVKLAWAGGARIVPIDRALEWLEAYLAGHGAGYTAAVTMARDVIRNTPVDAPSLNELENDS